MSPPQNLESKEIELRIDSALRTLGDVRNHALDVLRCDDARWIIRREREDLLARGDCNKDVLNDWAELVRSEKGFLLREYEWIRDSTDLDFRQLAKDLAETFSKIQTDNTAHAARTHHRVVPGIPKDLQTVLYQIPYDPFRQFEISSYQELSHLNPITINPQWLCRLISEYETNNEVPFSINRLFEIEAKALVLKRSGSVIGAILWDSTNLGSGNSMELLGLWVTPLKRRDGVASELIKRAAKVALRAGKEFLIARLSVAHSEVSEVLYANRFLNLNSRANTKAPAEYQAKISDIFHSHDYAAQFTSNFSTLCGGIDIARSLCRARRSLLRLACSRPSQSNVFKSSISNLHLEDQLSGKEREIAACRKTSQLRYNAKLQSLQAQTREIKRLFSPSHRKINSQDEALQYFSHVLSDLSVENRPDDFCSAVIQLGTVQWKYVPTLAGATFGHTVSVLDEDLVSQVLDLKIESQHSALISDLKDLRTLLRSEEVVVLATAKEKTLTGVSISSLIDESLVFHQIVVDERYRRAGYGRSLVNAMIAHAVFLRAKSVVVSLVEHNDAAVKLFASCGFTARLVARKECSSRDLYHFTLPLTERS